MAQIPLVSLGKNITPCSLEVNYKKKKNYDSDYTVIISSLFMPILVMLLVYRIYPFPLLYIYKGFPAYLFLEFLWSVQGVWSSNPRDRKTTGKQISLW